jgi:outer membrane receptor protein involved in Fe transport
MRRTWLVPIIVAVLGTGGCGDDEPPATGAPPTTATPATAAAAPTADEPSSATPRATRTATVATGVPREFVTIVRDSLPEVAAGRTDDEISGLARQICSGLAAGDPADDLVATTRSLGTADAEATDHATARELIKLAIDVACPGEADRVDEF